MTWKAVVCEGYHLFFWLYRMYSMPNILAVRTVKICSLAGVLLKKISVIYSAKEVNHLNRQCSVIRPDRSLCTVLDHGLRINKRLNTRVILPPT